MFWFAALIYPGIIVLCLLLALFAYIWYKKRMRLFETGTETSGIITRLIEPKPNPKNPNAELMYRMWIEYTVDGKTYKTYMHRKVSAASYQEGQEVTVIYDPEKPSRAVPKDFDGAKDYWKVFPIVLLCFAGVFLLIMVYSLKDVLDLSFRGEKIYGVVFSFAVSAGIIAGMIAMVRSDYYRREKEKDPKSAKATLLMAVPILGKFLFDAVFDLVFYIIL
ncbi:MAG: DUF3592 domain-containing protein [Ruminococcus sp.]|nr:DUF3592 domain-containing protein [Ruminococcus sp.]